MKDKIELKDFSFSEVSIEVGGLKSTYYTNGTLSVESTTKITEYKCTPNLKGDIALEAMRKAINLFNN